MGRGRGLVVYDNLSSYPAEAYSILRKMLFANNANK